MNIDSQSIKSQMNFMATIPPLRVKNENSMVLYLYNKLLLIDYVQDHTKVKRVIYSCSKRHGWRKVCRTPNARDMKYYGYLWYRGWKLPKSFKIDFAKVCTDMAHMSKHELINFYDDMNLPFQEVSQEQAA